MFEEVGIAGILEGGRCPSEGPVTPEREGKNGRLRQHYLAEMALIALKSEVLFSFAAVAVFKIF